jgi:Putative Zn-dependent protease
MRRLVAVLCLFVLLGSLAACTTNPATGGSSFTAFMSPEEEKRVGAEQHPKLVQQFGGTYEYKDLNAYVDRVGQSLARQTETPNATYTFTVLDDDDINAFALPGGYVHVTRGLLALASNEAELAGVLAHELGHVVARHAAQQYSQSVAANVGLTALSVAGMFFGIPPVATDLAGYGAQAYLQSYSRDQESEADTLAVRYMTRAGYDPQAMVTFFRKLDGDARLKAAMAGDPGAADRFDIMASHPRTVDRLRQVSSLAAAAPKGRTEQPAYFSAIDGMTFGDSPSQGIRNGRDFVHPMLRIAFRVPPAFILQNSDERVTATGPGGAAILFDSASPDAAVRVGPVDQYLTRIWGAKLSLRAVERFRIQDLDAATGVARVSTRQGPLDLRLVAVRTAPDRIYRFLFITPPAATGRFDAPFKETAYSFHTLSADEAAAVKPLRVQVVTVKEGDTVQSVAETMPFEDNDAEMLRLLNGLDTGAPLIPGQAIKTVAP